MSATDKSISEAVLDRVCAAYAAIADDCMGLVRRKAMRVALAEYAAAQQQQQAVAFEGTDREVLREFIRMCREDKPVGQWPGERVCAAIERSMANERPFRFIAEADMAPEREPSMKDADRALSGPRRNTAPPPSAPVGVITLSEFMAEQEALHPGIHDKVQAATDELRAEIERLRSFVAEREKIACGSDIVIACNNSELRLSDLRALLAALEAAQQGEQPE